MLQRKDTTILSEINGFFTSSEKAMNTIIKVTSSLSLERDKSLKMGGNNTYKNCDKLILLLFFPFFKIKDAYHYKSSSLYSWISCGKDVFYRFFNDARIDWRSLNHSITQKLLKQVDAKKESETNQSLRCLIVDDTDMPKTGLHIELISKVFSHVSHKCTLGFKGLFLSYHDGKSLFALDFSLHGEKGRNQKRPYGLRPGQLKKRFSKKRKSSMPNKKRYQQYFDTKIKSMIAMLREAISKGIRFDYLLVDSWFTCHELLQFIKTRRIDCHLLGMIKMGNTKYIYKDNALTAREILEKLKRAKKTKRSKVTGLYHVEAIVKLQKIEVKIFFCKTSKRGKWHGLMTTNLDLEFKDAYKIYSTRWSIEVFFKECKQNLGIGKCESRDFDAQIAHTTICIMQYNILATAKRFESYETMGELFRHANADSLEITISERIWLILLDIVKVFSEMFDIEIQDIMEKMITDNEQFTKLQKASALMAAA